MFLALYCETALGSEPTTNWQKEAERFQEAKQGFAGYRRARFPNYTTATRPPCDSTAIGIPLWDTTLGAGYLCDGATFLAVTAAAGVPILFADGTEAAPGIAFLLDTNTGIYRSTADEIDFTAGGKTIFFIANAPDAGVGEAIVSLGVALNAMNGADTTDYFRIVPANANHTGTGNTLNLLHINTVTGDANSNLNGILIDTLTGTTGAASETENAIQVGTGWDAAINFIGTDNFFTLPTNGNLRVRSVGGSDLALFNANTVVGTTLITLGTNGGLPITIGGNAVRIVESLLAMDGSDTERGLWIDILNANHTGTGNTVNILNIEGTFLNPLTGDANSNLNAINIGALTGTTGAAGEREDAITIGTGWDSHISSGDNIRLSVGAVSNSVTFGSTTGAAVFTINMNQEVTLTNGSAIAVVGAAQTINPDAWIQRVSAAAAADVTLIAAPPGTNTVATLTLICTDANLTFTDDTTNALNGLEMSGNFVCSAEDTITFARYVPASGNNRWVEVERSVN